MSAPLRLGTRASRLAMWQADWVERSLRALPGCPDVEIVRIETSGDRIQDVPLSTVGGRDFFTKDIENALLEDRIDFAVHSLKDLATRLPDGLALGAVLERADPRDALLTRDGHGVDALPDGAVVGTSSLRRIAFLKGARPGLVTADLRGNVPTRVGKLDAGDYDALILACAGLDRLGMTDRISERLDPDRFTPAPAQGAVGIELRTDDVRTAEWISRLEHADTRTATDAERALLRALDGGCSVPIGALARVEGDTLVLSARVGSLDGTAGVTGTRSGPRADAVAIGRGLAEELRAAGADAILDEIRATPGHER